MSEELCTGWEKVEVLVEELLWSRQRVQSSQCPDVLNADVREGYYCGPVWMSWIRRRWTFAQIKKKTKGSSGDVGDVLFKGERDLE